MSDPCEHYKDIKAIEQELGELETQGGYVSDATYRMAQREIVLIEAECEADCGGGDDE